ncbi:peptidoglycan DD-metalloendopeptidase family protein [Candidatus Saccharibacteria bacterium]|nr:peptidoglycan DD-metalloendopeptidase family protein [Candidatus Saccharibacteria bacterium]MBH1973214.1 peptidoglycan DD-metalloendopeptidase family protein [Candidatus Saccharibacteria bacterium]MBH1990545.1 peptidoglycan DD-metalloendopeptidase family protein [Candidatus Saccharibacteria bacterium]
MIVLQKINGTNRITLFLAIVGVIISPLLNAVPVSAVAVIDQDTYQSQNDVIYFEKCKAGSGGASDPTPITGGGAGCGDQGYSAGAAPSEANKKQIWSFFKNKGLSDAAVAGIMGNMDKETGGTFLPDAVNWIDCKGIVQWCYSRADNMVAKAAAEGKDWRCLDYQLDYIWYEITETSESQVMEPLKGATSPAQAANIFHDLFERSNTATGEHLGRDTRAENIYKEFTGQEPSPDPTSSSSSGSPSSCGGSQQSDKQGDGVSTGEFGSPLDNATITECYGGHLRKGGHYAMDWSSTGGTGPGGNVKAVDGGEVVAATDGQSMPFQGFGNTVVIKHSNGYYSRYSHLYSLGVKEGDKVSKGQVIGVEGNTGASNGTHLDFGISKNPAVPNTAESENPMNFIKPGPDTINASNCSAD